MADNNTSDFGGADFQPNTNRNSPNAPKKNRRDWLWWVIMAICWASGLWPIAVLLLVRNLSMLSAQQKQNFSRNVRRAADRVTRDVQSAAERMRQEVNKETSRWEGTSTNQTRTGNKTSGAHSSESQYTYTPPRQSSPKPKKKPVKGGNGLIIGGSIVAGVFGVATIATITEFVQSLLWGYFFSDELIGAIICGLFMLGGLFMVFKGVGSKKRRERYLNYLAYIGANREVSLAHMAASFDVPVQKLCKDLRKMLANGILPTGYLDLAEGKLFLTEMGYRAPEPQPAPEPEAKPMTEEQEDDILRQIRKVNDDIPDEVMSAKIDRIEEITGRILAYGKAHPEKAGQLRSFLNYYLPTTLKILRAYAQLDAQGIEGENISAAKARIEGMMDQVVAGFEKQLDKLFQDDAMDINSDVQVLENMLKKDGLSGDDGMTMTL